MILPSRKHLVMSAGIFGYHSWGVGPTGISWVEARDAAQHPTVHGMAPHKKMIWSKMSLVPRPRSLALELSLSPWKVLIVRRWMGGHVFIGSVCVWIKKRSKAWHFSPSSLLMDQLLFQRLRQKEKKKTLGKCWIYNEVMFLLVSWSASKVKKKGNHPQTEVYTYFMLGLIKQKRNGSHHLGKSGIHVLIVEFPKMCCSLGSELVTWRCWYKVSF